MKNSKIILTLTILFLSVLVFSMLTVTAAALNTPQTYTTTDNSIQIEVKYKKVSTYKITFNGNGGKIGLKKSVSTEIKKGSLIKKFPTMPKRNGHRFIGWYTKKSGGTKVVVNSKPLNDFTLYAHWKKLKAIEIVGDAQFVINTKNALALIKQSPKNYEIVTQYIGRIKQAPSSGMAAYLNPPTFNVGNPTSTYSTTWYATCIVHDAYHSKLYNDYLATHQSVPYTVWGNYTAEMKCLEVQISFQREIGAPQSELNHSISMRGSNWWDKPRTW